jgi:hypothetical protein
MPRRFDRPSLRHPSGPTMRINGETVSVIVAKTAYRCEECLAALAYKDAGLVCTVNPAHRGFIKQKEAAAIEQAQQQNINQLSEFYKIENGKVVIK